MFRFAIATLAACVAVTGCSMTDDGGSAVETGSASAATESPTAASIDYVALGDSYTSGPLISTVRSDPSGCARSTNNYPAFLAQWLEVESYRDVSCSGAATRDVTSAQKLLFGGTTTPPQRRALSQETDLVTVGLGGNDFDIFSRLSNCGRPLAAEGAETCALDPESLTRDATRVEDRLVDALRIVQQRAPEAEVIVVGYPRVLPQRGTCPVLGVDASEAAVARQVSRRLNQSQRKAARRTGATWVDLTDVSIGHDACAGDDAWTTGSEFVPGQPAPLHPRIEGMRGAAAEVYRVVQGQDPPASAGPSAAPDPDAVIRNETQR